MTALLGALWVALGLGLLSCEPVTRRLTPHIEAALTRALKRPVTIRALHVQLFTPALIAEDVTLGPSATQALSVSWTRARIRPSFWPKPTGRAALDVLVIEGLKVVGRFAPDPAPAPSGPFFGLPLDVRVIDARGVALDIRYKDVRLCVNDAHLRMSRARGPKGRPVLLEGRDIKWAQDKEGPFLPVTLRADLHLEGGLDRPRRIHIDGMRLGTAGAEARIDGAWARDRGQPLNTSHGQLRVQASGDLETLSRTGWLTQPFEGRVNVAARLFGSLEGPTLEAAVRGEDIVRRKGRIGDVQTEFTLKRASLGLTRLRLTSPDGGQLDARGQLQTEPPFATFITTQATALSLPYLLALTNLPDAWLRMTMTGETTAAGTLRPLNLGIDTDLASSNFMVLGASHRDSLAPQVLHIPNGQIRAQAAVSETALRLTHSDITSQTSRVSVKGVLPITRGKELSLDVIANGLELSDLGPIARVPFAGRGDFEAHIGGTYRKPVVVANLLAQNFRTFDYLIGKTRLMMSYRDRTLSLDAIRAEREGGTLTGSTQFVFAPPQASLHTRLTLRNFDFATLLDTAKLVKKQAHPLHARVAGTIKLDGPLRAPNGTVTLLAPSLHAGPEALGALTLRLSLSEKAPRLNVESEFLPHRRDAGSTKVRYLRVSPTKASLNVNSERFPLSLITSLLDLPAARGTLSGDGALFQRAGIWEGKAQLLSSGAGYREVQTDEMSLVLDAANGILKTTLQPRDEKSVLRATLGLSAPYCLRASLFAKRQSTRAWYPHLPENMDAIFTGEAHAKGPLSAPEKIEATLMLTQLDLTSSELDLRATAPAQASWSETGLNIAPVFLSGQGLIFEGEGALKRTGKLFAKLALTGDLAALRALTPQVALARGNVEAEALVLGTLGAPDLSGNVRIENAALRLASSESTLEGIDLRANFDGRGLAIERGEATLGGGKLRATGEIKLAPLYAPELGLHLTLDRVSLRPNASIDMTLNGGLDLTGGLGALALRGRIDLMSLNYLAKIDLTKIIPRRSEPLFRASASAGGRPMTLGIAIRAPRNVKIHGPLLDAELGLDLTLTGTTAHPGLLGTLTPLSARARYGDNTYVLTRGAVDFTDEYRIFTEFTLEAHTQACHMQADVTLEGNSDHYEVMTQGTDEHGAVNPADVLACLQFGLRLRDFDGNQRNGAGIGDALPGGIDALWAVSGLDEKVRHLLPVGVDEFRLTSGWSSLSQRTTARVLVGKELGSKLGVRYSRSLDTVNDQTFALEYRLANRATLQGNWLSARDVAIGDFGCDLRLHWELF